MPLVIAFGAHLHADRDTRFLTFRFGDLMRRLALALVVALAATGCSQSHETLGLSPTDANVAGSFALVLANGRQLPIIAALSSTEEWDLVGDQLVIDAAGTWTETTNYNITTLASGAQRTNQAVTSGTYAVANGQINFVMTTGGTATFSGSVTGNTLIVLYNGGRFAYSR